jgi:DNA-binding MarR family transcriptional regulator
MMVFMEQESEALKLENQLCFPLYACSREIMKQYKPYLKKLEQKGYLNRKRNTTDERVLNVTLTKEGAVLRRAAAGIPDRLSGCVSLTAEETARLQVLLNKILSHFDK